MKRAIPYVRVVLPTADVLAEYRGYQHLLDKLALAMYENPSSPYRYGYTLESAAQYIVGQWAAYETAPWRGMIYRQLGAYDQVINYFHADHLSERMLAGMNPDDAKALTAVMLAFAKELYEAVIPCLTEFDFNERQLETLEFDEWVGSSMVLKVLEE